MKNTSGKLPSFGRVNESTEKHFNYRHLEKHRSVNDPARVIPRFGSDDPFGTNFCQARGFGQIGDERQLARHRGCRRQPSAYLRR
jgi:hypothetical protein